MIKKNLFLPGLVVLIFSIHSMALAPYWTGGMLFFQNEAGEVAKKTRYKATVCGVETWYHEYRWYIEEFVANGPFYDWMYLPWAGWSWTQVNAETLTQSIWNSYWLSLDDVPSWNGTYDEICDALSDDRSGGQSSYWDPYVSFKWRSKYMETRYSEIGDQSHANANCWGTADYLAKDAEWIGEYTYSFPNGANNDGERFPHIYLDGSYSWRSGHMIDLDLDGTNGNVELREWGPAANDPYPKYAINTFDVIRLSGEPYENGPRMFEVDVGDNNHCLAYLCTGEERWLDIDPSSDDWRPVAYVYEKHNYGNTVWCPYGINILGHDDWAWTSPPVGGVGAYDNDFNAYFKKYGDNKMNLADYYCESWPGDGRIPQIIRDDESDYYGYGSTCNW
ncbi:MAG: hypothetical protein JW768_11120 [Chitinispirillaceae bacterium]|nr:hypothetical protein [Chitinispirillaceae bacterium]